MSAGRPPLRTILFDMDGVLVDSFAAWRALLGDAVAHFGAPPFTDAAYAAAFGQSVADDCAVFLPGVTPAELDAFYLASFAPRAKLVRMLPGALEVLDVTRARGLRLGCVTNAPSPIAREVLHATRLHDALEVILGADEVERPKPAPDLPLAAMKRLGATAETTALVGDSRFDVQAARAAGILAIGLGPGARDADLHLESLGDLPSLIDRLNG